MPAYALLHIDPLVEPARICNVLGGLHQPTIRFGNTEGNLCIVGATNEELEIIVAMINAIGQRVAATEKKNEDK